MSADLRAAAQATLEAMNLYPVTVSHWKAVLKPAAEALRAALGDEKLNWLGASYGTFLGATYADLFPDKVGRMVLDGVLPASLDIVEVTKGQADAARVRELVLAACGQSG